MLKIGLSQRCVLVSSIYTRVVVSLKDNQCVVKVSFRYPLEDFWGEWIY